MTRALPLAAVLVASMAFPAIATDTTTNSAPEAATTHSLAAATPFTMENAREHLMRQGYKNVSELILDANGNWYGSATKDGRRIAVAVGVKGPRSN